MSLTFWLMKKEKYLAAGLVGSLLLFKPQLVLGIGLLWLLENRYYWKSLIGLLLGGSILAGLSFWLLPEASRAYIDLSRNFLPQLIYQEQFPLWHLHSLRGFWILLFPGQELLAEGLSLILSFVGIVGYIYFWRTRRHQLDLLFAGAIILTIWISPHAMIYDWSILIVPAFLLWYILPDMRELWRPIFALVWLATFISGPLTFSMLKSLHFAIQISIPVFIFVSIMVYKVVIMDSVHAKTSPIQV
jgi:hypothetical protein